MEINDAVSKVHALAFEQGWWMDHEENRNLSAEARLAKHMLFVTEVAEASECVRNNEPPIHFGPVLVGPEEGVKFGESMKSEPTKPEGEAIELADVVIRIMDYFGFMGWDLEKAIAMKHHYNTTRALRHGGKAI